MGVFVHFFPFFKYKCQYIISSVLHLFLFLLTEHAYLPVYGLGVKLTPFCSVAPAVKPEPSLAHPEDNADESVSQGLLNK